MGHGVTSDTERQNESQGLKCSVCKSALYCTLYTCGSVHRGGRKFPEKLVKRKPCEKDNTCISVR